MKFTLFVSSLLLHHAAGSNSKGSSPHAAIEFGRTSFRRRVDTSPYPIHRVTATAQRELKTVKKRIAHVVPKAGKSNIALTNADGGVEFGAVVVGGKAEKQGNPGKSGKTGKRDFSLPTDSGEVAGEAAGEGIGGLEFGEVAVGGKTVKPENPGKSGKTGKRDFSIPMDSGDVPGEAADEGMDFGEVGGKTGKIGKRDFSLSMDLGVSSLKVMEFGKVGEVPINGNVDFGAIEVVGGKAAKRDVVFSMSMSMSMSLPFFSNDKDDVPIEFDDDTGNSSDGGTDDPLDDATDDSLDDATDDSPDDGTGDDTTDDNATDDNTTDDNTTDDNATDDNAIDDSPTDDNATGDNADDDDAPAPPAPSTPSTPAPSVDDFFSTPPTSPPAPFDDVVEDDVSDTGNETDYFDFVFEYLIQCANATLDKDTCLVSQTLEKLIDSVTDDDGFERQRFLQASQDDDGECRPPNLENELPFAIVEARQDCIDSGINVTEDEVESTLVEFMQVFSADNCWDSLCDDPSSLFFQVMFREVADCAGVELDLDQCIWDHLLDFMFSFTGGDGFGDRRLRSRVLQQAVNSADALEESSCEQPSSDELEIFVRFLFDGVEETCDASGTSLTDVEYENVISTFVTIFGSQSCWGTVECGDAPTMSPTLPPTNEGSDEVSHSASGSLELAGVTKTGDDSGNSNEIAAIPIPTEVRCGTEGITDGASERTIIIAFYYQVESMSGEPDLTSIEETVLGAVAGKVLDCDDGSRSRSLVARRRQEQGIIVVAVESTRHVIADEYICSIGSPSHPCHVVKGKLSFTVTGDDSEQDELIIARAEADIALAFASLSVNDPDIVDVTYIGTDPSALVTADRTNNINSAQASTEHEEESTTYTSIFIATAGAVIVLAALMTGFYRMSKKDDASETYDDKSSDGDSTAHHTADMTLACPTYDESSEFSSISPPHRCTQEIYAKHFILAEEEESNWRELGVLPSIDPSRTALVRVSEEPSEGGETAEMSI